MIKSVLLILALFATTAFTLNADCIEYDPSVAAVYNINPLNNISDYLVNITAQQMIHYNFCNKVTGLNTTYCKVSSAAVLQNNFTESCFKLTNSTIPKTILAQSDDPLGGIYLEYDGGDLVPQNTSFTYTYKVALSCIEKGSYNSLNYTINGTYSQDYVIFASDNAGCPYLAFYQLANFVAKFKVAFIIAGIVIGVFVGFFGLRLFKPTLFLTGFVVVFLLMAFILFTYAIGVNPSAAQKWGSLVGALALGVLAGILLVKLEKVGVFFLGAWLGISGSLLLYSIILRNFNASQVVLALFTTAAALICGIVALLVFEHAIILSTALGGAYIAIRAASLFAPAKYAYPNEVAIANEIRYNGFSNVPGIFYLYITLILVLAVGGAVIQYRHKKSRDEEKKEEVGYQGYTYHASP